ncbi:MAG: hypothetical protein HS122_14760 [Opitutaceae bacterium]|nr:hypothetical protein [Opitutaceae bacterium]
MTTFAGRRCCLAISRSSGAATPIPTAALFPASPILSCFNPTSLVFAARGSFYQRGEFHGQEYVQFNPLFGYQYSHVWIDPRGLADPYMHDKGIDYFVNARRATLANRAYCIANPGGFKGYGENIWGLSACMGPASVTVQIEDKSVRFKTYSARGASRRSINDDGTITPTTAGGSVPFAPEITIPALMAMHEHFGDLLFNHHGFLDAFNPTYREEWGPAAHGIIHPEHGWFDDRQLGIDQGPILLMTENHRTGFVWEVMKRSPYIQKGLKLSGFTADWLM